MIKVYQLDNRLKRHEHQIDLKGVRDDKELVKRICKCRDEFFENMFDDITIYVENIPKKICNFKELTIVIDNHNHEVRYFSALC